MTISARSEISRDAFAPTIYLILLGLSFVASVLAFISRSCPSNYSSLYSKTVGVLLCVITVLFLITISAVAVGFSINSSSRICEAVYIFCAVFWLAGKWLLYFWYNEKLYLHRASLGLVKTRQNLLYLGNILLGAPYVFALVWIFGAFHTIFASTKKCHIAFTYTPATFYILSYTVVQTLYTTLTFLWPSPPLQPRNFPSHPAIRIPPSKRKIQSQRRSVILYATLNLLTSAAPIAALAILLLAREGMPWWFFVSATAADLTLATGVTSICGNKRTTVRCRELEVPPPSPIILCESCAKHGRRGSGVLLNWFGINYGGRAGAGATSGVNEGAGVR